MTLSIRLTASWPTSPLPSDLKSVICRHFRPKKCVSASTIKEWTQRPETFFDFPDDNNPAKQLYLALEAFSVAPHLDHVDTVKRRVYPHLFQGWRESFKSRYHCGRADSLATHMADIMGSTYGKEKVERDCYDWSRSGAIYQTLAKKSGGNGALLVPCAVSRTKHVQRSVIRLFC